MKILVTGSSGMLGKDIISAFTNIEEYDVYGIDIVDGISNKNYTHHTVDIRNDDALLNILKIIDPDLIVHAAGIVNLETCETNVDLANAIHVNSSRILASFNVRIIYISTDSVFNGYQGNYSEESIPDPLNNYARTKFLGEYAVRANNDNSVIIRTNIFGYNMPLKSSICEWAIKKFENGIQIEGFDDVLFNAIYTKHLSKIITELAVIDFTGIINVASLNFISKYQFLNYLASKFEFPEKRVLKSLSSSNNAQILRPQNTTLNIGMAKNIFSIPSIYSGVDDMYSDYLKGKNNEFI